MEISDKNAAYEMMVTQVGSSEKPNLLKSGRIIFDGDPTWVTIKNCRYFGDWKSKGARSVRFCRQRGQT
jgi:hypothetical protein